MIQLRFYNHTCLLPVAHQDNVNHTWGDGEGDRKGVVVSLFLSQKYKEYGDEREKKRINQIEIERI